MLPFKQLLESLQEQTAGCLSFAQDEGVRDGDVSGLMWLSGVCAVGGSEGTSGPCRGETAAASGISAPSVCHVTPSVLGGTMRGAGEPVFFKRERSEIPSSHIRKDSYLRLPFHNVPSLVSLF